MFTAGVDVGAATAKAVVLNDRNILSYSVLSTGGDIVKIADKVIHNALTTAKLAFEDLECIVGTGYGRNSVSFAHKAITEIACHAKGANFLFPETRMVRPTNGTPMWGMFRCFSPMEWT